MNTNYTAAEREAFDNGYNAAWDGMERCQNGYPAASDEAGAWDRGYDEAAKEIREEQDCAAVDADEYASIYD